MIRLYFKQAWNLIKQEKIFSTIYIIGTGLSITVVMVLAIVFYLKVANIYPETNRDRLLVVRQGAQIGKNGGFSSTSLSPLTVETCFRSLKGAEAVTATFNPWGYKNYVQPTDSKDQWAVQVKYVDTEYWTVFPFRFVDGKPFTDADMQSGIYTAVIAESLAKRLFGNTEVTGNYVHLNFRSYRIAGVVKDASFVTERTYAQMWVPYTTEPKWNTTLMGSVLGRLQVYILAPSVSEVNDVKAEALEYIERYNQTLEDVKFELYGQPDRQWQSILRNGIGSGQDFNSDLLRYGLVFLILLLVPAISLSGMTESRMERRLAEMGVRRAFGAPNGILLQQILLENFLYTLLGGIAGLLFSYFFILLGKDWIMQLGGCSYYYVQPSGVDVSFTPSMFLNIPVFCVALGVCFLLNLFSALIPAWRASHREIVYSLTSKQ